MLGFLICAQLAAAAPRPDSVYSSVALREMVAAAAEANRHPPRELQAYTSHIETELALILRDTLGREHAAEVEQLASEAHWTRSERYELHIVGYRAQNVGVPYSTLSVVRGWTVPTLFGERLSFGAYIAGPNRRDTLTAVHPFATDRDAFYRYSGGDTVAVLRIGDRRIPIARIRVRPEFRSRTPLGAFDGEIDIDAVRHQIVRMRGQLEILGAPARSGSRLLRLTGIVSAAYVEFVNSEIAGKYWLPTRQRTEFQASVPLLGQTRAAFRIVSTIGDIAVVTDNTFAGPDTSHPLRVIVTWAPSDSVSRFSDWREELGTPSGAVHSDDFQDMAPPAWRTTGPPRVSMFPNSLRRIFRFNRIEGLYLGLAPTVDLRSAQPGLSAGLFGGWAFSEKSARGGAFASYARSSVTTALRAERALVSTNDFTLPVDDDPGFSALLTSVDDHDYVDRRSVMASISRALGSPNAGRLTVQIGLGDDRAAVLHIEHGPFSAGKRFRPNRGILEGGYTLGTLELEFHPNVTGDFVSPGVGARAQYEIGRGDLHWDRIELGLAARHYWGPLSVGAHADGGVVLGKTLPPQQVFELGGTDLLPGYDYKTFAGDQSALFRAFASYRFPIWNRPVRVWQNFFIPGLAPGIATSVQGGWTRASTRSAAEAVRELGVDQDGMPVSVPTGSVRSTVGIGLSFFADIVHVGVARPVDHPAPWRVVAGFGVQF